MIQTVGPNQSVRKQIILTGNIPRLVILWVLSGLSLGFYTKLVGWIPITYIYRKPQPMKHACLFALEPLPCPAEL